MKYYKELPNGYKEAYSIDAGNKKTGFILNLLGLPITLPRGIGVPGRHAAAGGLCRGVPIAVRGVLPGALRRPHHPGICRRLGAV